jgi:hypothetical protein
MGEQVGLKVPKEVWDKVTAYLDAAGRADGSYGYNAQQGNASVNLVAVGLLCRQLIGSKPNSETFEKGIKILKSHLPGKDTEAEPRFGSPGGIYYLYWSTQVMNHLESEATEWNRATRAYLVPRQEQAGADAGSWDGKGEAYGILGRVMCTSLALLTLQTAHEPLLAPRDLKADEVEALWKDLAGDNALKASQSLLVLASAPKQTLPFLEKHLRPVAGGDQKAIERWSADLSSTSFAARQKAAEELEKQGELAVGALEKILADNPPLDLRRRVEGLLAKVATTPLSAEQRQTLRSIRVLARIGTPEARQVLETLAGGLEGARVTREAATALKRLAVKPATKGGK